MGATTRRGTLAGAALALSLLALPALSSAAPAASTVQIDATLGFDGMTRNGTPTPLRVLVASNGFFAGLLRVTMQGPQNLTYVERQLEIPGGSRKEIHLLLPRSSVTAVETIDRGGRSVGRVTPSGPALTTEPLIGVISLDAPPVSHVEIPILEDDARVVPIARAIIDLGAESFRGLSHLLVDADAAAGLSPRQVEAITQYAAQGGELIVAASSERALAFLPAAWRGSGGGDVRRTRAGSGWVTVALAGLQTADWSANGSMWPRVLRAPDISRWTSGDLSNGEWLSALGQSGRFRRPTLGWLLAFVIGYVALAGPVNFVILARMKRRELAWITIPGLAVLFAVSAFVIGRGVRNVPIKQGVGVISFGNAGEADTIALGVLSRSGGAERVRIPGDWLADALLPGIGGPDAPRVVADRSGVDVQFKLSIGAFGTATARRFSPAEPLSAGSLNVAAASYEGTVRNPTRFRLRQAAVLVGPSSLQHLGTIEAGGSSPVSITPGAQGFFAIEQAFFERGFDPSVFPNGNPEGFFSLVRLARTNAGLGDPGRAYLIGLAEMTEVGPSLGIGRVPGSVIVVLPVDLAYPRNEQIHVDAIPRTLVGSDGVFDPNFGPVPVIQNAKRSVVRFDLPGRARTLELAAVDLAQFGFGKFGFGGPGGDVVVVGPDGQPVQPRGAGATALAAYDYRRGTWRTLAVKDGSAALDPRSHVSPDGEVLIRMTSDFGLMMTTASLSLEAVLA